MLETIFYIAICVILIIIALFGLDKIDRYFNYKMDELIMIEMNKKMKGGKKDG